jgi:hypothetical protein
MPIKHLIYLTLRKVLTSVLLHNINHTTRTILKEDISNHNSTSTDYPTHRDDKIDYCNRNALLSSIWGREGERFVRDIKIKILSLTFNSTSYRSYLPSFLPSRRDSPESPRPPRRRQFHISRSDMKKSFILFIELSTVLSIKKYCPPPDFHNLGELLES